MRTAILNFLLLVCLSTLLFSCTSTKDTASLTQQVIYEPKSASPDCFVQMVDGSFKNYSSLQLVTGIYKEPHLLADGKLKIYPEEIIAYQNKRHYAISAGGFSYGGHKSNLASETLPGFAIRIATGRLNVYVKKYRENNTVMDEYYFQEGNGHILVYSPELMSALIKNEPEALEFFNNYKKRIKLTKELKATAKLYNDSYFNIKDDVQDENKLLLARGEKKKIKIK